MILNLYLFSYVQGGKIAVVNSQDLIKILMLHAKMSCLRDAAGDTHVEVNLGGAAVIARAVQAATNPTEGQRILQTDSIEDSSAFGAAQGVIMPPTAVHVISPSIAVKTRMRKVSAFVLKTIPALQNLPDSCLIGLELRQIEEGEVDENGQDIGGFFVMVDVAAVLLYKDAGNARKFARNPNFMNKEILTSLTWVNSGNPNVSNILFQYYFLDNFLGTRGIEGPLKFFQ